MDQNAKINLWKLSGYDSREMMEVMTVAELSGLKFICVCDTGILSYTLLKFNIHSHCVLAQSTSDMPADSAFL